MGLSSGDPSSFSKPEEVAVTFIDINLRVDFPKKILHGYVDLTLERINANAQELFLDSSQLKISKVSDTSNSSELSFNVSERVPEFGEKITVNLPKGAQKTVVIRVEYETDPAASGLQWLTPAQTMGKKHPFLFSQCQAIHARSVVPCQDTPSVKSKYKATITAPAELSIVMSAIPESTKLVGSEKQSVFTQNIPIPSYLIALAVGALASRQLGPRSHVWAEQEIIEACAFEFSETEHQLRTAEEICGPYVWGIYDLLVLPPSFAFGGMENPCLTFVTPTLLAGDRSLANVVAHEIAHSWTGNLITNRNFEHFWLNEGFTVFVERKIKGRLTSALQQDFDAIGGLNDLEEAINHLGKDNHLTKLVVHLDGVHPDDAFSTVPYEKGHTFLRYLEEVVGGPKTFEPFLRAYFDKFKYKSIETADFKAFFEEYFRGNSEITKIDWDSWLHTAGMPIIVPEYNTSLNKKCDGYLEQFLGWNETDPGPLTADHHKGLSSEQVIYFLQKLLQEPLSHKKIEYLGETFNLRDVKNAEIKFRWLRLGLKAHWTPSLAPTLEWISEVGRMKFARPLYRDLYDWEEVRPKAIENFKKNRDKMMHVVAYTVSKDLHLTS